MALVLPLLSLSLLSSVHQTQAAALVPHDRRALRLTSVPITAFRPPSADVPTSNFVSLTKTTSSSPSTVEAIRRGLSPSDLHAYSKRQASIGTSLLTSFGGGIEYLTDITFGNQTVKVIVDTGSSDTWLPQVGFQCLDYGGNKKPTEYCKFGPLYAGTINQIPNENFQISYGDGEFVTGIVGTQDITIAGITVTNQTAALGTSAYWNGDNISSGLLGLAYPGITSAYSGTDPTKDSPSNRVEYDPIFTTMYKKGLSDPMFSMAIQRDGSSVGGYLAFGGLPPSVSPSGSFAATPLQILTAEGGKAITFYTITPDAFVYTGAPANNSAQFLIDSGTTLSYLPTDVVKAVADLFSPKAAYNQGGYFVDCTAAAPNFGIKIGGTTFTLDPRDLILKSLKDTATGKCLLGINDGGSGPYILGDSFMNNVIVVFDVGAAEMRFAANSY